jgi:hypothetical protein
MSRQPTSRVISISRWLSHPPQRVILFEQEDGRPSASRVGDDGSQAGRACVELAAVATSGVVDRRRHSGLADCSSDGAFARRALLLRVHSVLSAQHEAAHGSTRVVSVAGEDSRGDQQIVPILRLVDGDMRIAQLATLTPAYAIITRGL